MDSPGERPFPPDEEAAATAALAGKLLALGELDMDDVQVVHLGYRELAKKLHYRAPTRDLSADASYFPDSLTEWACVHIINFFTQRSTFVARTLVEQNRQLGELITRTDVRIERPPSQSAEDAGFERRYGAYIAKKYGSLTIYGVDLNESRDWPLNTACPSCSRSRTRSIPITRLFPQSRHSGTPLGFCSSQHSWVFEVRTRSRTTCGHSVR